MSRSRKRTPVVKVGGMPGGKRAANRRARRADWMGAPKGSGYKRLFSQYDVHDFVQYGGKCPPAAGKARKRWEKAYFRK